MYARFDWLPSFAPNDARQRIVARTHTRTHSQRENNPIWLKVKCVYAILTPTEWFYCVWREIACKWNAIEFTTFRKWIQNFACAHTHTLHSGHLRHRIDIAYINRKYKFDRGNGIRRWQRDEMPSTMMMMTMEKYYTFSRMEPSHADLPTRRHADREKSHTLHTLISGRWVVFGRRLVLRISKL